MGTGLRSLLLVAAAWMHHAKAHSSYVFTHWELFIGALVLGPVMENQAQSVRGSSAQD